MQTTGLNSLFENLLLGSNRWDIVDFSARHYNLDPGKGQSAEFSSRKCKYFIQQNTKTKNWVGYDSEEMNVCFCKPDREAVLVR